MASGAPVLTVNSTSIDAAKLHASDILSIKDFAESARLTTIPSSYNFIVDPKDREVADELKAQIPVIDFSLLTSDDPELHAKGVQDLGKACEEWGFFVLINHGIDESLMENMIKMANQFHNMAPEEKAEFSDNDVTSSIRCGTSYNAKVESVHFWRDYLKVIMNPDFTFPDKPAGFKDVAKEYCETIKDVVVRTLLRGASESLGLEPNAIAEASGFDNGLRLFVANLYPHVLNQSLPWVNHNGKWVNIDNIPKSIGVNVGDQLEVLTNARYKSVLHRAVLNNKATRLSLGVIHAPEFQKVISAAPELLKNEEPVYKSMTYEEYYLVHQKTTLVGKSKLASIRIKPQHDECS
ncbi:hypothetical protein L6164_016540 [Bauhinia variegata]|uniref:Uncharacterized protein n=1 Tax=Bauhinia variegata TaxID=167791 RepID=A0ACB9NQA1_BAUVA|nr:hypothetical protein L6164_016540 [Bauhinia variegata]